ncbi:MAG TPA: VOC family protein [Acidimicrobiales bacterium]|nr:VOC family protein [Acidimicrobiales bacterium]
MELIRTVVVFDAADLSAESEFWAGVLDGHVVSEDDWHSVLDASGEWRVGVQLAPNHTPPEWPDGAPQQIHLDLHAADFPAAHDRVMALGARLLQAADDLSDEQGHQVYADPAGHPFCIGWGQPSHESMSAFAAERFGPPAG